MDRDNRIGNGDAIGSWTEVIVLVMMVLLVYDRGNSVGIDGAIGSWTEIIELVMIILLVHGQR